MRALLAILVIGCGGGGKASTTPKEPPTCAAAADAMVALAREGRDNVDEEAAGIATIIRTRCEEDQWSAEAKNCLAAIKTAADADRCGTHLTAEQQANLVADQEAKQKKPEEPPVAEEPPPTPAPAPDEAQPAAVQPPPPPAKPQPSRRKKSRAPDRRQGDPCDGGE